MTGRDSLSSAASSVRGADFLFLLSIASISRTRRSVSRRREKETSSSRLPRTRPAPQRRPSTASPASPTYGHSERCSACELSEKMTPGARIVVWFAVLGCAQAVTLEVKDGNSTCIKAELSASFSIRYNTTNGTTTARVPLPDSAAVDRGRSSCGTGSSSPWLVVEFGRGHALALSFSTNGSLYSVANLTLQYNLSDTTMFPEANSSAVVTVVSASVGIGAVVNTTYRCMTPTTFTAGGTNVTFSDVRLEAYMPGNDLSPTESVCAADGASTTAPPTTPTTTAATSTTAAPPPAPPAAPERGTYSVKNRNGTVCLLAQMGLQLNVSYSSQNKTIQDIVNVNPNVTTSSGSCEANRAVLVLSQEGNTTLRFIFTLNSTSNKYHLSGIRLQANWSDMTAPFSASNTSLDYLRSTLGRSYMCNAEQTLDVLSNFSLNTFRLQVQPFGVTSNQFATAEECQMDQDQMLIPIIVGAALAGLVLIVLIAYLIGKRRSHAGYQTI
ncbi:lysosome-associated membrane glycoprotein 1a [Betta splendens]|uniref:Lysosome-associated membrane glycoprotein 1 n=1 Tax=Betta splendens TaxID=158456 RepID=A0A6P7M056_BETSP|nr:lysosome-associated membrane glycoprotein 1a [Betta splendens]